MTNPLEGTTPGPPWHIEGCDHGVGGLEVVAKGWGAVCHGIPDYDDLGDENPVARLIASAPDLATENATLRKEFDEVCEDRDDLFERFTALRTHLRDVVIPALDGALSALAHADGEPRAAWEARLPIGSAGRRWLAALRSTRELVGDG